MLKRILVLAVLMSLLTGCATAWKVGGKGSDATGPSTGSSPQTVTINGTYEGLTDAGWVKIKVPETSTVLELELQKEIKPTFESMNLKVGEAVVAFQYTNVPKIAGIFRANKSSENTAKETSQQPGGPAPDQDQKPEEIARCKDKNDGEMSLAGIKLRSPSDQVLPRLGKPTKVETFPKYGDSMYHFTFGTVHVLGQGQVTGITFWTEPPIGDLWPGIRIGAPKETVLGYLAGLGFCGIPQPNKTDVAFPHASVAQLLMLSFSADGLLQQVSLNEMGE